MYNANFGAITKNKVKKRTIERADSRSKKDYNPAACGMKTTFIER